jgi:hypothetical protein
MVHILDALNVIPAIIYITETVLLIIAHYLVNLRTQQTLASIVIPLVQLAMHLDQVVVLPANHNTKIIVELVFSHVPRLYIHFLIKLAGVEIIVLHVFHLHQLIVLLVIAQEVQHYTLIREFVILLVHYKLMTLVMELVLIVLPIAKFAQVI